MSKKHILVLGPKVPQASDLSTISSSLAFLETNYDITILDTLSHFKAEQYERFKSDWQQKLSDSLGQTDVFMGFSIGGVILQHCLDLFKSSNKKIILFSPPSIIDERLKEKLYELLRLIESDKTQEAVHKLSQYVHPNALDDFEKRRTIPWPEIKARLAFGLQFVLNTSLLDSIEQNTASVLQLIGENSQLVKEDNIIQTQHHILKIIPNAGMRVLEDNPEYCHKVIKDWLNENDK